MCGISFILQEHKEAGAFIKKMLDQVSLIPDEKEVLIVTSSCRGCFLNEHDISIGEYSFPIRIIGDIQSCGAAREAGANSATYKNLLFMDMHVCFDPDAVARLMDTLEINPRAIVAPGIRSINFPECTEEMSGIGHGVAFTFKEGDPFAWSWIPSESEEDVEPVPCCCGCVFSMRKDMYNDLVPYGGFMGSHTGLSFEEGVSMRLWRIGHETLIDKGVTFGHLYKGYEGKPGWDDHSTSGYYKGRVAGAYVNIFNPTLWEEVSRVCKLAWGDEWDTQLEAAKEEFSWLRDKLEPFKDVINERWFFRV